MLRPAPRDRSPRRRDECSHRPIRNQRVLDVMRRAGRDADVEEQHGRNRPRSICHPLFDAGRFGSFVFGCHRVRILVRPLHLGQLPDSHLPEATRHRDRRRRRPILLAVFGVQSCHWTLGEHDESFVGFLGDGAEP